MISAYLVDEIIIVTYANDKWGKSTRSVSAAIAARVEDVQLYVKGPNGVDLLAQTLIIIEYTGLITWNNKIMITKRNGVAQTTTDKEYPIKKLEQCSGFISSHYEVYI